MKIKIIVRVLGVFIILLAVFQFTVLQQRWANGELNQHASQFVLFVLYPTALAILGMGLILFQNWARLGGLLIVAVKSGVALVNAYTHAFIWYPRYEMDYGKLFLIDAIVVSSYVAFILFFMRPGVIQTFVNRTMSQGD